jgi:hypothetical protein
MSGFSDSRSLWPLILPPVVFVVAIALTWLLR